MLQNINQPELCNGTRLAVQKLMSNMTEATILTGPFNDEDALIPRIPIIPTETLLLSWTLGLYVACSRAGKPLNLYIYTENGKTKNVVYPEAL
ncbi:ATP-dependent DNA helicase [Trichonephila clavipes]|nr:ATP-dependent DNA helicase [Trichonephila clavipes]